MPCEQCAGMFRAHKRQQGERCPATLGVQAFKVLDDGGPRVLIVALGQAPTGQLEAAAQPKGWQRVEWQRLDALRVFGERTGDGPIGEKIVLKLDAVRRYLNQHAVRDKGRNRARILRCDADQRLAVQ